MEEEGILMLNIESLISVISLVITSFGLGYAMGSRNRSSH